MKKEKLLEMAREAGFMTGEMNLHDGSSTYTVIQPIAKNCAVELKKFVDVVLELAAQECENSEAYRGSIFAARIRNLKGTD